MWLLGSGRLEKAAKEFYLKVVNDSDNVLTKRLDAITTLNKLTSDITELQITKSKIEEGFAREKREIEHKLGLERRRQEQDLDLAKRKATIDAEEKFLEQKKDLFEKEMKFTRDQFTSQVDYLKNMVAQVLDRLPDAKIIGNYGDSATTNRKKNRD